MAMAGNFNIQYNFTSASIAVSILGSDAYLGYAIYPEPRWSKDVSLAAVFFGAMLGMISLGRLGDMIGRQRAMRFTLALSVLGAAIPAVLGGGQNLAYAILILGRFLLGVGVGGIYPLSAVAASENGAADESRASRVGWAFFWQTPGAMAPYAVAMLLAACLNPPEPAAWVPQTQFRLLFLLGVLPASVVFVASLQQVESEDFRAAARQRQLRTASSLEVSTPMAALRSEPSSTYRTLIGTAGSWFTYDVAYYGTNVFTNSIVNDICMTGEKIGDECHQTLLQNSWESLVVMAFGIPGALLAIMLVSRIGSKRLNVYGFLLLAASFTCMAMLKMSGANKYAVFAAFCFLQFSLNWGPNVGTFVIPAICFPAHMRSTCHGISAFGGKLGALIGTLLFPFIKGSKMGLPAVMLVQAVICVVGAVVSQVFLRHDWEYTEEQKNEERSFIDIRD